MIWQPAFLRMLHFGELRDLFLRFALPALHIPAVDGLTSEVT
jgi:hypothetical protein